MNLSALKPALLSHLKTLLDGRIQTARQAMEAAQASANEEGKSSAGDKYETARAMGQLTRELHARPYAQARHDRLLLEGLPTAPTPAARPGSLVHTDGGEVFFLSVGVGPVTVGQTQVFCLSPQTPLGQLLMGKKPGETFVFRNKTLTISSIT